MASIIDKINQIRQAVFGKDVRKAIADGIEAINAEVENNTAFINSKVEEVTEKANNAETQADYAKLQGDNAKIIYDNWKNTPVGNVDSKIGDLTQVSAANIVEAIKKDRSDLDNKASQADLGNKSNLPTTDKTSFEKAVIEIYNLLINKLSKSDVQSLIGFADINKNLSKIDQTMFTDELIAQIAGTAAVNAVSADGSIIFKKMAFPALVGLKSKNLFNKDTVTNGSYVSYSTGNLVGNATYSVSDYIPVSANTAYIKKTNQQIAFYDSNKVYISGLASPTSFTTPANTAFVRITVTNSTLNIEQLELGTVSTEYESYYPKLDPSTIKKIISKDMLTFNPIEGVTSKNLFNKDTVTSGYYVSNSNGTLLANASFVSSDYIPVNPSTQYAKISNSTMALYDSNKAYISGLTSGTTFTTPPNAFYVRISVPVSSVNIEQVEVGSTPTSYESYYPKLDLKNIGSIPQSKITETTNSITVKTDGTGNFNNLSSAIASVSGSSKNNPYTIYIYEGMYDVFANLTTAERNNIGILLPDYVDLVGIGDRDKVVLKGELPDTTTVDESTRLSTLNVQKNNKLTNITVTAKNCRYAVHADNSNTFKDYAQYLDNCVFEHFGNVAGLWGTTTAWGEGTASGAKVITKNCKFITHTIAPAFNTHNNVNYDKGDYHEFENCDFINKDGSVIGFTSLNSTKVCKVLMKGCRYTGSIALNQSNGSVVGLDYEVSGYGNEMVPHVFTSVQNVQKYINFSEETSTRVNYSKIAISRGTPVKHKFYNQTVPMDTTDDKTMFLGLVAVDCLSSDENVVVKTKGYFPIANTTLTGVTAGDKIGIVNGQLAKVTDANQAIAVIVSGAWMKLL